MTTTNIAGVDEVGRGPLIGNVVAAAVILPEQHGIQGLTDSKKLSEKKREKLFNNICEVAISYSIAFATPKEIDKVNILQATMLAMARSIQGLNITPDLILIDGNRCPDNLPAPAKAIVKGDLTVESISAASILAKVARDRQMLELDKLYPEYGFASHKGYPTKQHLEKLAEFGVIKGLYRESFAPVRKLCARSYVY